MTVSSYKIVYSHNMKTTIPINRWVFYTPLILLVITLSFNLIDNSLFMRLVSNANTWVLTEFGWLFTYSTFGFLVVLFIVYFSPLAKIKIGGKEAVPLLNKWRWFAICICTTIATGILFWGCAEPLFHYFSPPANSGILASSPASSTFAISTLFMHWSFTPYGIYCICGLVFGLVYYNLKQPFKVGTLMYPLTNGKKSRVINDGFDIICLYSLVLGMSASLGSGVLAILGGMEALFGVEKSNLTIFLVGFFVIAAFVVSAITGLQKGIKFLSTVNILGFVFVAVYIFVFGFPLEVLQLGWNGLKDYTVNFVPRSINFKTVLDPVWMENWTLFYLANWFAWAPIGALFLGRIARGYTVRQFINFNLIAPSLFAILWMTIFSGSTLYLNELLDNALYFLMENKGEEAVMYRLLDSLPWGMLLSAFTLFLVFLSYVTAADSNISAMSAISSKLPEGSDMEPPAYVKIVWGVLIGVITYVMLSSAGIDGIRILSVLGGFPSMFIVILATFSLILLFFKHRNL